MKKKFLIALIVVAVLAISTISFFVIKNFTEENEKKEEYSSEKIVEMNKNSEITFLNQNYDCEYLYTKNSFKNGEKISSVAYYKTKDGKYDIKLQNDTSAIREFSRTEKLDSAGSQISRSEAIAEAEMIILQHKGNLASYDMKDFAKSENFIITFNYVMDGYDTENNIVIKLSETGELISYSETAPGVFEKFSVARKDYEESLKIISDWLETERKQYMKANGKSYRYIIVSKSLGLEENKPVVQVKAQYSYEYEPLFTQAVKYTTRSEKNCNDTVYIDKLASLHHSDTIISKEEAENIANKYIESIKENNQAYELQNCNYSARNDIGCFLAKYSYKIGEYLTDNCIILVISADGEVYYAKENNCDCFTNVIFPEEMCQKVKGYMETEYEKMYVQLENLDGIKHTIVSKTDDGYVFTAYVGVKMSRKTYKICMVTEI